MTQFKHTRYIFSSRVANLSLTLELWRATWMLVGQLVIVDEAYFPLLSKGACRTISTSEVGTWSFTLVLLQGSSVKNIFTYRWSIQKHKTQHVFRFFLRFCPQDWKEWSSEIIDLASCIVLFVGFATRAHSLYGSAQIRGGGVYLTGQHRSGVEGADQGWMSIRVSADKH